MLYQKKQRLFLTDLSNVARLICLYIFALSVSCTQAANDFPEQQTAEDIKVTFQQNKIIAATYPPATVKTRLTNYFINDFNFEDEEEIQKNAFENELYNSKIVSAVSYDGIRFERTAGVISERGSFPSLVYHNDKIICYYQTFSPGTNSTPIVATVSNDKGRSWQTKNLTIHNIPKDETPVYPYAVKLPNGRIRLYFILNAHFKDGRGERLYYAESTDEFTFYLKGVAFGSNFRYPSGYSIINRDKKLELFIRTSGEVNNFLAGSVDGRFFVPYARWSFLQNGVSGIVHSGAMIGKNFRVYVFWKGQPQIRTYYTSDMTTWTPDNIVNLYDNINERNEDGTISFPSVVPLEFDNNKKYMFMAYVTGKVK